MFWSILYIDLFKICGITLAKSRRNCTPGRQHHPDDRRPKWRSILLTSIVVILAGIFVFAWQHELRPRPSPQAAREMSPRPEPRAPTAEEEGYAASLWEIHREVTPSAVAMSFAGIVYETETHDARQLEQKIEPIAKFFGDAERRVGGLAVPYRCRRCTGNISKQWFFTAKPATRCSSSPRMADGSISSMRRAWALLRPKIFCVPARCCGPGSTSHTS